MQHIYNVIYKGKKTPVFSDSSLFWNDIKFSGDKFLVKPNAANNIKNFDRTFNQFAKTQLQKIIEKR